MKKLIILLIINLKICYCIGQVTDGLEASYPFDNTPEDIIGTADGNLVNDVTASFDRFEKPKSCYYFSRSYTGYISIPDHSEITNNSEYSVSLWFQDYAPYAMHNGNYKLLLSKNQNLDIRLYYDTIYFNKIKVQYKTNYNKWFHLVCVQKQDLSQIYLDGTLIAEGPFTFNDQEADFNYKVGVNFAGNIDDILMYNRALLPFEISELYYGTITSTELTKIISESYNSYTVFNYYGVPVMTSYNMDWEEKKHSLNHGFYIIRFKSESHEKVLRYLKEPR